MKTAIQIICGTIALACGLGIAIDMVTAHVAVEYFTVHHPKVVESRAPWVMALVWGVGASWWFGLLAGGVLAMVNARLKPPLAPRRVLVSVARSCAFIWTAMMLILAGVYSLASIVPESKRRPSFESDRRLVAVAMAHETEYVLGAAMTLVVALRLRRITRQAPTNASA